MLSEIERIIPMSNLELRDKNIVGDNDLRTGLAAPYSGVTFADTDSGTPVTPVLPAGYS